MISDANPILNIKEITNYVENLANPKYEKKLYVTLDLLSLEFKEFNQYIKITYHKPLYLFEEEISPEIRVKIFNFINIFNRAIKDNQLEQEEILNKLKELYLEIKKDLIVEKETFESLITKYFTKLLKIKQILKNKFNIDMIIYISTIKISKNRMIFFASTLRKITLFGEMLIKNFIKHFKITSSIPKEGVKFILDKINKRVDLNKISIYIPANQINNYLNQGLNILSILAIYFPDGKIGILIKKGIIVIISLKSLIYIYKKLKKNKEFKNFK